MCCKNTVNGGKDLAEVAKETGAEIVEVSGISEKEKLAISAEIISAIDDCFEVCKYYDADVFHLGEELYRKFGEEWKMSVGKTYLDDLKLKISVNVNVK